MQQVQESSPTTSTATGGLWLALGALLSLGGLAAVVVQFTVLKQLFVPWYAAGLATAGVLLIAVALFRRMSLMRGVILVLFTLVAVFEWYVLTVFVQVPAYAGPAAPGQPIPAFTSTFADGTTFSDNDLRGAGSSVLLFFRGRRGWSAGRFDRRGTSNDCRRKNSWRRWRSTSSRKSSEVVSRFLLARSLGTDRT